MADSCNSFPGPVDFVGLVSGAVSGSAQASHRTQFGSVRKITLKDIFSDMNVDDFQQEHVHGSTAHFLMVNPPGFKGDGRIGNTGGSNFDGGLGGELDGLLEGELDGSDEGALDGIDEGELDGELAGLHEG